MDAFPPTSMVPAQSKSNGMSVKDPWSENECNGSLGRLLSGIIQRRLPQKYANYTEMSRCIVGPLSEQYLRCDG